jgi:glutamine cyclotransferase
LPDNKHFVLSSGWYKHSRINVFSFNFDKCSFKQTFEEKIDPKYFGEGIARVDDKIYQLTWREKRIVIWNIVGKNRNKLDHQINKTMPRFNKIVQGWGAAT